MFQRQFAPALVAALAVGLVAGCGSSVASRGGSSTGGSTTGGTGAAVQGQFVNVAKLSTARVNHTATLIRGTGANGGKVLIAGGQAKLGSAMVSLDTAELYDPATGAVSPVQNRLSGQRAGQAAVATALGDVLLFGGYSDAAGSTALRSIERFRSTQASFSVVTGSTAAGPNQLSLARADATAILYAQTGAEQILVAGGRIGTTARTSGDVFAVDGTRGASTVGRANLRFARYGADAVQLSSGKILVAGGLTRNVELYTPQSGGAGSLVQAGQLSAIRFAGGLAVLGGQAAVIGGRQSDTNASTALASIELYDEALGTFQTATVALPQAMSSFSTVPIQGGVMLIGGQNSAGQVLGTAVVISADGSGQLSVQTVLSSMKVARRDAEATLLANGTILVTGGYDQNGAPVADVELFVYSSTQVPTQTQNPTSVQPVISALSPATGPVGTTVTVSGTGFSTTPAENHVTFSGIVAPVQSVINGASGSLDLRVVVPPALSNGAHPVVVTIGTLSSAAQTFTVGSSSTGGTGGTGTTGGPVFNGPPHILFAIPSSAGSWIPIVLVGSRFADPSIPYVNGVPSVSLFNFGLRNIPFIGGFTIGTTLVPVAAPSGPGSLQVEYQGYRSNQYPFTKN